MKKLYLLNTQFIFIALLSLIAVNAAAHNNNFVQINDMIHSHLTSYESWNLLTNTAPNAMDDSEIGLVNSTFNIDVSINDGDIDNGDLLSYATLINSLPSNGSVAVTNNQLGIFSYTPNTDFVGQDSFQYVACDNGTPSLCDTATVFITVLDSTSFILNVTATKPTYCGLTNGIIEIQTHSFSPNLEYSINNGATWFANGGTFNNLDTGDYYVMAKEIGTSNIDTFANNPVRIEPVQIPEITLVTSNNTSGCSTNDGSITVAGRGKSVVQFSIDGGMTWHYPHLYFVAFGAAEDFGNLPAGIYSPRIKNGDGSCIASSPDIIINPTSGGATITSVTPVDPTNNTSYDGTITIAASNGSVPLMYSIDNINWQSSNTFTGLQCGEYSIYVQNANSTCKTIYGSVTLNCSLVINTVSNDVLCISGGNTINIDAQYGTLNREYSIDSGATWNSTSVFSNLLSGNYYVFVRDSNTTLAYANNPVIVNSTTSSAIVALFQSTPSSCGMSGGSISITAIGSNLSFSIDSGSTYQSNNNFPNLSSGSYLVYVKDTLTGCADPYINNPVILTPPNAPVITDVIVTNPTDCSLANGMISIIATGGSGNLQYSIDGGVTWVNASIFTHLLKGTYEPRVRNQNSSCETYYPPVDLIDSTSITIHNVSVINVSNCNAYDGTITVTATGTQHPLEYSIDGINWQTSNIFTYLGIGNYSVWVRYNNATCPSTASSTTTIGNNNTSFVITSVTSMDATNCGVNDGSIIITASGSNLAYSIDGGFNYQPSGNFSGLSAGTYHIYIKDTLMGCPSPIIYNPIIIASPAAPIITNVITTNPTDCGLTDGTITINATGGMGVYEYSINGINFSSSNHFSGLSGGTYQIVIKNTNETCPVIHSSIVLVDKVQPVITNVIASNPSNCGVNDGSIDIIATGLSLQYSIDNGMNWQSSNTFLGLPAGTYHVIAKNADGTCVTPYLNNPVILNNPVNAPSITTVNSTDPTDCGVADGTITITATGGTGNYEYSIDGGAFYNNNGLFTGLAGGTYQIIIRNPDGTCPFGYYTAILLDKIPPVIDAVTAVDASSCGMSDGSITITATGLNVEYSIDSGLTWQSSNTFLGLSAGTYHVMLKNADGTCVTPYSNNSVIINPTNPTNSTINVQAGIDRETCVNAGVTNLIGFPTGGTWSGVGIADSTGIFDPSIASVGVFALTYTYASGANCSNTDTMLMTVFPMISIHSFNFEYNNDSLTISTFSNNYDYSIDNGLTWQSSNVFYPVIPNSYYIGIRYSNNNNTCAIYDSISLFSLVAQNDTFYNTFQQNILSNDLYMGLDSLIVNPTLISSPLYGTATIDTSGLCTYTKNSNFSGIDSFQYEVYINGNTISRDTATVYIQHTLGITSVIHTNTTNCTASNGTIDILAYGTNSLQYSIDSGLTWLSNSLWSNLWVDDYNILLTDGIDTIAYPNNPVTISPPSLPSITNVTTTNVSSCNANDGTIILTASGGTPPFLYTIDGGTNWQASNLFTGLSGGNYSRSLMGISSLGGSCQTFNLGGFVTLTEPDPIILTNVSFINPINCSMNNGTINVIATGTTSLLYSINNGLTWENNNGVYTGLSCGTYIIRIKNANNLCEISGGQVVLNKPLVLNNVVALNTVCNQNESKIQIDAQDGSLNYEYSIDSGLTWQIADSFTNIATGNYYVFVRDGIDTVGYVNNPVAIIQTGTPTFTTFYGSDAILIVPQSTANIEFTADCGATWQATGSYFPSSGGIYCSGVRYTDGSCPVFSVDTFANTLPLLLNDSVGFPKLNTDTFNVLQNDFDAENNALQVTTPAVINVGTASVTIDILGNVSVLTTNFDFGTYTFNYTVCEVFTPSNCATATATFTVYPPTQHIYDTIAIGATHQICIPNNLNGSFASLTQVCNTPTNFLIDSIVNNCLYLYADNLGDGSTCLVMCDNLGICDTTYLHFNVQNGVWPGDTDDDTYVNNVDLLNIGLAYGSMGTPRDSITTVWNGYITPLWNLSTPVSNVDYRHIDANGDGTINSLDTMAILQNYNLSYQRGGGSGTGLPLSLGIDSSYVLPHFSLPILLGNASNPATGVYGGAFSILYDTTYIKPGSVFVTFDNSWLGTNNLDMISLSKNFWSDQQIDVALTRINGMNILGFGQLGKLNFTIKDDILQRGFVLDSIVLDFHITNPIFIDADENVIDVSVNNTSWAVTDTKFVPNLAQGIKVFPNPTRHYVQIQSSKLDIEHIIITDMVSRKVYQKTPINQREIILNINHLPEGVYNIQLKTPKVNAIKRLIILK